MSQVKLERQIGQSDEGESPTRRPYYGLVRNDLAQNILNGKLRPGVVLLESPIARLLGVSRGPVQRALELRAGKTAVSFQRAGISGQSRRLASSRSGSIF